MTISDCDRQILVQALRELADGNGEDIIDRVSRMCVGELRDYAFFGVGAVLAMDEACLCGDAVDASGYLSALADLVDAEGAGTCRNLSPKPADDEQEQPPVYTDWLFKCSYCGWDGQIWKSVGHDDMSLCETNYCPNCGEAVLE